MSLVYIVWTVLLVLLFAGAWHMQRTAHRELDEAQKDLRHSLALHKSVSEIRHLGDDMAARIRERWSGDDGCDCPVCSAAAAWEKAR